MNDYPVLMPPSWLDVTNRRQWTSRQAIQYRDWLLPRIVPRVHVLLDAFHESEDADGAAQLLRLGIRIQALLREGGFGMASVQTTRTNREGSRVYHKLGSPEDLPPPAYAVGADMGMLIVYFLMRDHLHHLWWSIQRRSKKTLSYNCPILCAHEKPSLRDMGGEYLSPIPLGTLALYYVHCRNMSASGWREIYLRMDEVIRREPPIEERD